MWYSKARLYAFPLYIPRRAAEVHTYTAHASSNLVVLRIVLHFQQSCSHLICKDDDQGLQGERMESRLAMPALHFSFAQSCSCQQLVGGTHCGSAQVYVQLHLGLLSGLSTVISDLLSFCLKDGRSLQDSYICTIISGLLMRLLSRAAPAWQIIHTKSDMINSLLLDF